MNKFPLIPFGKKMSRNLAALAVGAAVIGTAFPAPAAEAFGVWDAVNIGIGAASMHAQKEAALKQYRRLNETEDGRQEWYQRMRSECGVSEDVELNQRADSIMANLSKAVAKVDPSINEMQYLYFVNPSQEINAFCTFGRVMSLNAGILQKIPNDDEIAVVVGHEMGHGQKNHTYRGVVAQYDKTLFANIAVAAEGGSFLGQLVGNLALVQSVTHGNKGYEKEADELSFEYMANSGYNIGATAAVWQRVLELTGDNSQNVFGSVFMPSDHPNHAARRDTYVKKLYEYGEEHATAKDGTVTVNGKVFVTPVAAAGMSAPERSYFVLGNLAKAFHNGEDKKGVTVVNGTVKMGNQSIITPVDGDESAETLAARLEGLLK